MAWVTLNPFSHTSDLSHHQTWCFYLPPKSQCYNFWPLYHQHPGPRHCHLSPGLLQWPLHLGHFPWPAPLLSVCAPAAELGFQNVSQVTLLLCSKPSDSSPMLHILPAPQPASHSVSCPLWPLPLFLLSLPQSSCLHAGPRAWKMLSHLLNFAWIFCYPAYPSPESHMTSALTSFSYLLKYHILGEALPDQPVSQNLSPTLPPSPSSPAGTPYISIFDQFIFLLAPTV